MYYDIYAYTGEGKSRATVVHIENDTIINNNTKINSVLGTHNCKATFANPCIYFVYLSVCPSTYLATSQLSHPALLGISVFLTEPQSPGLNTVSCKF